MPPPRPSPGPSTAAHAAFAASLIPDLPLLMHGSGDVDASRVDPDSVAVLADLTAQYVSRLVGAAVDAHDIQTDGAGGLCPPPHEAMSRGGQRKKRARQDTVAPPAAAAVAASKPPGGDDDFWDEPLPEPKVKKQAPISTTMGSAVVSGQPARNGSSVASAAAADDDDGDAPSHHSQWIGLSGVDVFSQRRRAPYSSVPSAVGKQCFIFPICHDAALYGRVMEVQAARRNLAPVLVDPVLMDMVRDEGRALVLGEKEGAPVTGDTAADEAEAEARAARLGPGDEAVWPGLEGMLPTHRGDV